MKATTIVVGILLALTLFVGCSGNLGRGDFSLFDNAKATSTPIPAATAGQGQTGTTYTPTPSPVPTKQSTDQIVSNATPVPTPTSTPVPTSTINPAIAFCSGVLDGSAPRAWANLTEISPGIKSWEIRTACWGIQETQGITDDLNGEEAASFTPKYPKYEISDGVLVIDVGRKTYNTENSCCSSITHTGLWGRFRLTSLTSTGAEFTFVKKVDHEVPDEQTTFVREVDLQYLNGMGIPDLQGREQDVTSVTFAGNGFKSAALSDLAAIRWGQDTVNISCLPYEGGNTPNFNSVSQKSSVGRKTFLYARSEELYSNSPAGQLWAITKDGLVGSTLSTLFPLQGDLNGRWLKPVYLDQYGQFFMENTQATKYYTYYLYPNGQIQEDNTQSYQFYSMTDDAVIAGRGSTSICQ